MADRELMPIDWLRYLKQRLKQREWEIHQHLLQVPEYPPLPACPDCDEEPTRIDSRAGEPAEDCVLVDFTPCGHRFKVPTSELLHG